MMRIQFAVLFFAVSLVFTPLAAAHGDHVHSLRESASHAAAYLEAADTHGNADFEKISAEKQSETFLAAV